MLKAICEKRNLSPRLVRQLLHIESTPPRQGKRGVVVRSREAIETFSQDPGQLVERETVVEPELFASSGPSVWLRALELRNFAQFENAGAQFEYLAERPICLVEANNGHGKSTLIQAVLYALYGTSRARAPLLVHHSARGPEARVEVRLTLGLEGHGDVEITRFGNFHKGAREWTLEQTSFTLITNQGERETLHDDDAQEWVKMYLPQEVFSFFCFDAESSPVNNLAEGSNDNIAEALESVLGITSIRATAERCRKIGKEWEKEIGQNFSHRTPKEVKAHQAELAARRESTEKELAVLGQERQRALDRGARIDTHLESLLHSFDPEAEVQRQRGLARLQTVREQLEAGQSQAEHLVCTALPVRLLEEHLEFLLRGAHSARIEQAQQARVEGIREAVEAVAEMACRQTIPWAESPLPSRAAIVERLLSQMDLPEGFWSGYSRFTLSEAEIRSLERLIESARQAPNLPDWLESQRALRAEQAVLRDLTQTPREQQASHQDLMREHRRLLADKESVLVELAQIEESLRELGLYRTELQAEEEEAARELKAARTEETRRKRKELCKSLAFEAAAALDELASTLRGQRVNTLEAEASLMLRQTTNKPELYDKVSFHRTSLTFQVLDRGGDPVPSPRSTGERTVLAMAVVHGLQKAAGRLLPMIVEAPLKPLDPEHMSKVVEKFFVNHPGQSLLLFKPEEIPPSLRPLLEARVHQWLKIERPQPDRELSVLVDHSARLVAR